jgi:transposase
MEACGMARYWSHELTKLGHEVRLITPQYVSIRKAREERCCGSHYDLYDKPEPVEKALAKLIPFYTENL